MFRVCILLSLLFAPHVHAFVGFPAPRSSAVSAVASEEDVASADAATADTPEASLPHMVVVGGGWGGWGAAKALLQSGCRVTLIDAQPDPTGRTPFLNANGRPVDVGQRGFWKDYPNIEAMASEIGLAEDEVWTPFTNSSFYSPEGLEATAPVFSSSAFPQLPSPLGQILATFPLFERLPLSDRASMAGLLAATLDALAFDEGGPAPDEEVLAAYDRMSAHELFQRFGLSDRLVADFITPTLLVGLFKPPHELSALVTMELLYYYALAHQDSFDVRWIKTGTVASSLIAPLASNLLDNCPLTVLGSCAVTEVLEGGSQGDDDDKKKKVTGTKQPKWAGAVKYKDLKAGGADGSIDDAAGVVLALGAKGMKAVVRGSPLLASEPPLAAAAANEGVDVVSVRLWLDRVVPTRTPANVFASFPQLQGAGGTFFMLDQLQCASAAEEAALWGEEAPSEEAAAAWSGPKGSVLACDFYNAGALLGLGEEDLERLLLDELLPAAVPEFKEAMAVDRWVGKFAGAVSWFAPGSFVKRPKLDGAGKDRIPNVKCAGDWVRLGKREHGAKGLCQERAFVSGIEAANALLDDVAAGGGKQGSVIGAARHSVLGIRPDEPQVVAGMEAARRLPKPLRYWIR